MKESVSSCPKRTLYECSHARVCNSRIYCDRGHNLSEMSFDGSINVNRLVSGMPLALSVCQDCVDFDRMGPPVPGDDKGWLKKYEVAKR